MLKDYFGAVTTGKLKRLRFVGLWVALIVAFFGFGILVAASIGVAEHMIGRDLAAAQNIIREKLAIPAIVGVVAAVLAVGFANLNIMAKRARDVGLPGWITAIVIAAMSGSASQMMDTNLSGGMGGILLIILAVLPSGMIKH
jgi:uncharacterized membrane protein YhaH (DUF805 family)